MKLKQIAETEGKWTFSNSENTPDISDPQWENQPDQNTEKEFQRKMQAFDRQAELLTGKFDAWTKLAKGKVFTVTGPKSGMQPPKQVSTNPRKYLAWTLSHSNPTIVTKVFVDRDDPQVVLPIRALVARHNELTDRRAEYAGRIAGMKAASKKDVAAVMDQSGSMQPK